VIAAVLAASAWAGPELAFAARTRPAGAAILATWWGTVGSSKATRTDLGLAADVYFLWYEPAARVRTVLLDGFLVGTASVGAEPGFYLPDDRRDGPRTFLLRPIGRAQLEVNWRNTRFWLYGRANVLARNHPIPEWDPFRFQTFDGPEITHEHALAAMVSPGGDAPRKLWIYGEVILQDAWGIGAIDRNVRLGVIVEKLSPTLTLDADGYWSFMDNGLGGPGVLGLLYWSPGARERG
jgi:hypothetical protein